MWLKIVIALLSVAMIASLFTGLHFLKADLGRRRRTLRALGIRVGIAVLLAGFLAYGFSSGRLTVQAPWHGQYQGLFTVLTR